MRLGKHISKKRMTRLGRFQIDEVSIMLRIWIPNQAKTFRDVKNWNDLLGRLMQIFYETKHIFVVIVTQNNLNHPNLETLKCPNTHMP